GGITPQRPDISSHYHRNSNDQSWSREQCGYDLKRRWQRVRSRQNRLRNPDRDDNKPTCPKQLLPRTSRPEIRGTTDSTANPPSRDDDPQPIQDHRRFHDRPSQKEHLIHGCLAVAVSWRLARIARCNSITQCFLMLNQTSAAQIMFSLSD